MNIALVDWEKCSGCGDCVALCPVRVFEMEDGKSNPVGSSNCMDCGNCKDACPEGAIIISMGWGGYKWPVGRYA